ncbi:hypothetical protein PJL18_00339 [Paenarthrobacter nicotinovorans]|nr:hypothetical protein [Paenarthrobacter nicotinovorans]
MNVSPGSAVMRTTILSERTLVPPVTEDLSPPDSLMTGADSPVMVDSSTLARPSMISPSEGMTSPASQMTTSLSFRSVPATTLVLPSSWRSRAVTPWRLARRLSAWAFPRPSAMASESVPNSTVSHSHAVTAMPKMSGFTALITVQAAAPTSTTNMTGEWIICRGSSFLNATGRAARSEAALSLAGALVWCLCSSGTGGASTGWLGFSDSAAGAVLELVI